MGEELTLSAVSRRLDSDALSADLQWSLLSAAAHSYRHDTVLRPFPPMFIAHTNGDNVRNRDNTHLAENRNYDEMAKVMSQLPSFNTSKREELMLAMKKNSSLLELLHWTLSSRHFTLKTCDASVFDEITALTGQCLAVPPPDHIFAVTYNNDINEKFDALRGERGIMFACHGSRLENFHSILNYGLQGHMNKNALFGEGTYLSSELSVCLHYSPTGTGWDRSLIGCRLSCVAVCEIIDDPSVKCKVHDKNRPPSQGTAGNRARIAGSMGGDVPEKYYVVQNNEMIRVRYILVYTSKDSPQRQSVSWVQRHRFILVLGLYMLLLLVLALFKSQTVRSFFRR